MPSTYRAVSERSLRDAAQTKSLQLSGAKPSWMLYMVLGMFALLKDMLDLAFGVIPVAGTVLVFVIGLCFSLTAFLLLTVFDASGSASNLGVARQMVRRAIVFVGVTLVGLLPVITFLPETTLAIIVLYSLAYHGWKKAVRASGNQVPSRLLYASS